MIRVSLFGRYASLIALMVSGLVVAVGLAHFQFSRSELLAHLQLLQTEKAAGTALQIERFVLDLESQLAWLEPPSGHATAEKASALRLDFIRAMRQAPEISTLSWIGPDGLERLAVSRMEPDRVGSMKDAATSPHFQAASAGRVYFGTPYYFLDSEPYMTIARPLPSGGIVSAEINLKFIWDVVARLSDGTVRTAYVVGPDGTLLAHPDLVAVLGRSSVASLPQVAAARGGQSQRFGRALSGEETFSAHAGIPALNWTVFVDTQKDVHLATLDASLRQTLVLLLVGVAVSVVAGFLLARRLVKPLQSLQAGVERIGAGEFGQPIAIRTGDELEQLAAGINRMAAALRQSYEVLESRVAERTEALAREQERSHALLRNMLPADIADELVSRGQVQARRHDAATILFTDFAGFTEAATTMPPDVMVSELNDIFAAFDRMTEANGVDRIKTIGDAYMAAAGVSSSCDDHARRCVRAALEMVEYLATRNGTHAFKWGLRVGIHSGPVIAGVVGTRKFAFDVWGDTVNLASRMESSGEVGRINISAYTFHLVQSEFECVYRGKVSAKGKGEVDMYFVVGPRGGPTQS